MSAVVTFLRAVEEDRHACKEEDPDLFFTGPESNSNEFRERQAKAVCRKCPVVYQCLEFAMATEDKWAILGGTNPTERGKIRDQRQKAQEAHERLLAA